jgi:hypothetical protein
MVLIHFLVDTLPFLRPLMLLKKKNDATQHHEKNSVIVISFRASKNPVVSLACLAFTPISRVSLFLPPYYYLSRSLALESFPPTLNHGER